MKTIGIDIGGSKIRSVLWDGKKIIKFREFRTPKNLKGFERVFKKLVYNSSPKSPSSYCKRRGRGGGVKIGIGIAGVVEGTKIIFATNIKYLKNFNFKSLFSNLKPPISNFKVDNDARTFALAEYNLGAGKNAKNMLMIILGTGIGRAFVKNSNVLKIRRFEYAEDWEKDYQKIKNKKALAEFLGEKLGLLIDALNPKVIVLGGGVIRKKGYFEAIKNQLSNRDAKLVIKCSKLGKFAGAIGAAMLWTKGA